MKQSLQLRLSQSLTMTPQLQQAIRLLQLSSLELQTEIQLALESNLMLEPDTGAETVPVPPGSNDHAVPATLSVPGAEHAVDTPMPERSDAEARDGDNDSENYAHDTLSERESGWESSALAGGYSEDPDFDRGNAAPTSLKSHLSEQLALRALSERDRIIAELVIDAVGDDGYLEATPEELLLALPQALGVELDEVEAVRHLIQQLDPLGCASLDLRDALSVQLRALPESTPHRQLAIDIIEHHIDLLGSRQWGLIERKLRLNAGELKDTLDLIRSCDPRPGTAISETRTEYITPDVYVLKHHGDWRVELNSETSPRIRVNSYYASLIRKSDSSAENSTLRQHLQEARWLIKSLRSRNETLLKVANCIVRHQRDFLEFGEEAMKPLILKHVADEVGMHESTISRVTTQKYMSTPRGIREFKYFFSSHVGTTGGDDCSATAIRARIRRLIGSEDVRKPLSDSRLTEILNQDGINVARRTVAKYRESMQIGSSTERRRMQ
jgi:RNA polymerase sigma-54 factor